MRIELDTENNVLAMDGVRIDLDLLRVLVNPDVSAFYRFERKDSVVIVRQITPNAYGFTAIDLRDN